jgi:hypothetical protein
MAVLAVIFILTFAMLFAMVAGLRQERAATLTGTGRGSPPAEREPVRVGERNGSADGGSREGAEQHPDTARSTRGGLRG